MVALLDLPTEILEMVLRPIVKAANPSISTPASSNTSKAKALHDVLSLRLVHSKFRALVDPLAFQNIACTITHKREAGTSRASNTKPGVLALMESRSEFDSYVERIAISCDHGESTRQSPYILDKLEELLDKYHATVRSLSFHHLPVPIRREFRVTMPLYTNLSPSHWPNLRDVRLMDVPFVFCLPQILAAAPLLDCVALSGDTWLSDPTLEGLAASIAIPASARGSASNPLTCLGLYNCGERWLYRFLSRLKLHARVLQIDWDKYTWRVTPDEQVAGLRHIADTSGFKAVAIRYLNRSPPSFEIPGIMQRIAIWDIQVLVAQAMPKQAALCSQLKREWEGRQIPLLLQRPVDNISELLRSPDVTLSRLLEFYRVNT